MRQTAVHLLEDVVCSIRPLGADNSTTVAIDLGDSETWTETGIVTLNLDKLRVATSRTLVDHSTAQQKQELNRIVKENFTISIDTKLLADGLDLGWLTTAEGQVVGIHCTSVKSSFWVAALVESFDITYDHPSTLTATLKSYGYSINWDYTT